MSVSRILRPPSLPALTHAYTHLPRSPRSVVPVRFRGQLMSGSASIQTGRRPVHRGESDHANPRRHGDDHANPPPRLVLARLSSRGWSRTRRPSPRTRPRTTAPWTAGRAMARSPPSLTAPRQSAPRPQILLPSAATSPRPLVRDPQLLQRWEEPCDDMLPRPCIRKKATWIGDMYLGLGLKGQSLSIFVYQLSRISS
ncbi:hypothetical protein ACQJBY_066625 [Aegilops geniculata]